MHSLFTLIPDLYLLTAYTYALNKQKEVTVIRTYQDYILINISLRELDEPAGALSLFQIEKDLTMNFDDSRLNKSEQDKVKDHFKGMLFPIK